MTRTPMSTRSHYQEQPKQVLEVGCRQRKSPVWCCHGWKDAANVTGVKCEQADRRPNYIQRFRRQQQGGEDSNMEVRTAAWRWGQQHGGEDSNMEMRTARWGSAEEPEEVQGQEEKIVHIFKTISTAETGWRRAASCCRWRETTSAEEEVSSSTTEEGGDQ